MPVLAGVTPDLVAQLFPAAPTVSPKDLQAASDWAERELRLSGTALPASGTAESRELQRAISAYALSLQTGGLAASTRVTTSAGGGAVKSIALGTLKLERAAVNTEALADGMATSAADWLVIAGRHLSAVGDTTGYSFFPGAAR